MTILVKCFGSPRTDRPDEALKALVHGVMHALRHRPDGLIVKESGRKSSLESAKTMDRIRRCGVTVPVGKLYEIGSDVPYQQRYQKRQNEKMDAEDRAADAAGQPRRVRWERRGHYRDQAHGPRSSLRKSIYIARHWCGREDAPVLVRALRLDTPTREAARRVEPLIDQRGRRGE